MCRLASDIRRWIENCDHEAVFTQGGCFHFALRLSERFGCEIRGIETNQQGTLGHVWGVKKASGEGVDIRGIYPECFLAALAYGGKDAPTPQRITVEDVKKLIAGKGFPPDLNDKMYALADWIIEKHERFKSLRGRPLSASEEANLGNAIDGE